ncbi:MAG: hypothetical protein ACOYLH_08425 [Flavobacteriales bacterium]
MISTFRNISATQVHPAKSVVVFLTSIWLMFGSVLMISFGDVSKTSSNTLNYSTSNQALEHGQFELIKNLCSTSIGAENFSESETADDKEEENEFSHEWFLASVFENKEKLGGLGAKSGLCRISVLEANTPPLYILQHSWKSHIA